eukprot:scaffold56327_cov68-Phaeocystis_antarctica.AAC.10
MDPRRLRKGAETPHAWPCSFKTLHPIAYLAPPPPLRPPRSSFAEFSDEATEIVAPDELLALQLEARRGRGVVVLEP